MAKKNTPISINEGIVMGDMNTIVHHTVQNNDNVLKNCIALLLNSYIACKSMELAEVALTTSQIQTQIATFCGIDFPISEIYRELTAQGFVAEYGDSIELGLNQNFYWLFIKK